MSLWGGGFLFWGPFPDFVFFPFPFLSGFSFSSCIGGGGREGRCIVLVWSGGGRVIPNEEIWMCEEDNQDCRRAGRRYCFKEKGADPVLQISLDLTRGSVRLVVIEGDLMPRETTTLTVCLWLVFLAVE